MIIKLEDGRELTIERLPLGKYAELFQAFQELPKHLKELTELKGIQNEEFYAMIPKLIGLCLPDIIRMVPIATGLSADETEKLGFTDLIEIVYAVYVVNNYQAAFEKLKKFAAQRNLGNLLPQNSDTKQ